MHCLLTGILQIIDLCSVYINRKSTYKWWSCWPSSKMMLKVDPNKSSKKKLQSKTVALEQFCWEDRLRDIVWGTSAGYLKFPPGCPSKCAHQLHSHWFHTDFKQDFDVSLLPIDSKEMLWILSFILNFTFRLPVRHLAIFTHHEATQPQDWLTVSFTTGTQQSSFPVMHKVDNVDIFVLLKNKWDVVINHTNFISKHNDKWKFALKKFSACNNSQFISIRICTKMPTLPILCITRNF